MMCFVYKIKIVFKDSLFFSTVKNLATFILFSFVSCSSFSFCLFWLDDLFSIHTIASLFTICNLIMYYPS